MGAPLGATWAEEGALPGPITLVLEAVDQDEQDKLDLENFARGLTAPTKEDAGGKDFARGTRMRSRAMSPLDAARLALAFFFGGGSWLVLSSVPAISTNVATVISIGAFVFGLGLITIVSLTMKKGAQPLTRMTRGLFQLRFDAGFFTCSGTTTPEVRIELARVRSFTGGRRLSVELTDAPAQTLPLSVLNRNNTPLAARLNDLLAASRATSSRAW